MPETCFYKLLVWNYYVAIFHDVFAVEKVSVEWAADAHF